MFSYQDELIFSPRGSEQVGTQLHQGVRAYTCPANSGNNNDNIIELMRELLELETISDISSDEVNPPATGPHICIIKIRSHCLLHLPGHQATSVLGSRTQLPNVLPCTVLGSDSNLWLACEMSGFSLSVFFFFPVSENNKSGFPMRRCRL